VRSAVALRLSDWELSLPFVAAGAAMTVGAAYLSAENGAGIALAPLLGALTLVSIIVAFVAVPHVAFALTLPLFVFIPALKVFVNPSLGALKEIVVIAALVATTFVVIRRRIWRESFAVDSGVVLGIAFFLALYLLNVGGGFHRESFGDAWLHGVRLASEPFLLLLAGMVLGSTRTVRWTLNSLIATGCAAALTGVLQQIVGEWKLYEWGYAFNEQIRTIDGRLRSFGPMDEPFSYAAFMLICVAAVLFWMRPGLLRLCVAALLLAGLTVAFVRTAPIVLAALLGVWLVRRGHGATAALVIAASLVTAIVTLATTGATATESRTVQAGPSLLLTINGRTDAWGVVFDDPKSWPFGKGVGEVGTAAERAGVTSISETGRKAKKAVDSGYFAVVADIGLAGLAVLAFIFARIIALARRTLPAGGTPAWLALAFLTILALDAITRASFTGFPTAFVALMLVGLSLAAAAENAQLRLRAAATSSG
jgi:hypothetical protein